MYKRLIKCLNDGQVKKFAQRKMAVNAIYRTKFQAIFRSFQKGAANVEEVDRPYYRRLHSQFNNRQITPSSILLLLLFL